MKITPEKVQELLESITTGEFPGYFQDSIYENDLPLVEAAPEIARAYLAEGKKNKILVEALKGIVELYIKNEEHADLAMFQDAYLTLEEVKKL